MKKLITNIGKTFAIVSGGTAVKLGLIKSVMFTTELSLIPSIPIALFIMSILVGGFLTFRQ
jgi:hypothetical protein